MSTLTAQLRLKDQQLSAQADEHSKTKVQVQLERANLLLANMGAFAPGTAWRDNAIVTAVLADMRPADTPCCCHSEQSIRQKSTSGGCMDTKSLPVLYGRQVIDPVLPLLMREMT
ncbi:MAG: hypothetical protein FRX49_11907 [Trebouxia sp. A1-2]|nr:MAG: hypothetical protein FRX49_11907 [Trebouxia sp. A1-2]